MTTQNSGETPYVCMPANSFIPFEPVKCFEFDYPSTNNDHSRFCSLVFKPSISFTIHGFVGYFASVLYKDVLMSIVPKTHSNNLHSWFPMYFPIKNSIFSDGKDVIVNV